MNKNYLGYNATPPTLSANTIRRIGIDLCNIDPTLLTDEELTKKKKKTAPMGRSSSLEKGNLPSRLTMMTNHPRTEGDRFARIDFIFHFYFCQSMSLVEGLVESWRFCSSKTLSSLLGCLVLMLIILYLHIFYHFSSFNG